LTPPDGRIVAVDFGHRQVRVAVAETLSCAILAERHSDLDVACQGPEALELAARLIDQVLADAGDSNREGLFRVATLSRDAGRITDTLTGGRAHDYQR
jgi:hypothetical protein